MKKRKQSKVRFQKKEVDLISNLPDVLLTSIISLLPRTEGVRTSILSKRWKTLWKYSSHLSFDQRQMSKPSIEDYLQTSDPIMRLAIARCRKVAPKEEEFFDEISKAAMLITSIVDSHNGPLKTCSIRHLPESCASGDVVEWMKKLLVKELTLK
ncbi:hypothetical protein TSUD_99310 [Trifolium subterraneum]|uniref:F-box domain-containing protein n=1 Tax=Trifolium subterraneum TaxID=3900 RepID=A0A2Z6NYB3_TRISU|nr:hypothetical protein TSUD_99310 [Trifolium subterraneum]